MVGLEMRKTGDRHVLEVLLAALDQPTMTDRGIEAACIYAGHFATSSLYDPEGEIRRQSDDKFCKIAITLISRVFGVIACYNNYPTIRI